jgi:NADH-quinone oxidoreductase subunit E
MSVRRLAVEQPEGFAFTPENLEWAKGQITKYPEGRQASAVLALLWRAQEQSGGWLPEPALRYIADMLGLAYIRIYEIATFYTMFNLAPVGRYYLQVCGTTPCWLRGADAIKATCRKRIGEQGHMTPDGLFSWTEVECLGACVNAPVVQINKYYYEDLTPESLERLLDDLKAGRPITPGPQNGRQASAPEGGPITLIDPALYANEEREEELVGAGASLTDHDAKRPGKAANMREAAVPKPPLGKGRKPR